MTEGAALAYLHYACDLAGLEPQMRAAVLLDREGYGRKPIADALQTTEGAVSTAVSDGKRLLRLYPWNDHQEAELILALKGGEERTPYGGWLFAAANRFGGSSRTPIYDSDNNERADVAMRPATVTGFEDVAGIPWRDGLPRSAAEVLAMMNEWPRQPFGPGP